MPRQPLKVSLPHLPQQPQSAPFPVLALIAPIVGAIVMWALVRSPFILMFAFLGPVMALATMGDSRRRAHGDMKKQQFRFEDEVKTAVCAIDKAHDTERNALARKVPSASALICAPLRETERWRGSIGGDLLVRVGHGSISSGVDLDDSNAGVSDDVSTPKRRRSPNVSYSRSLSELRDRAAVLDKAPIVMDARFGIGIFGARAEAAAVATSIVIQLATTLSPHEVDVMVMSDESGTFDWARFLPHRQDGYLARESGYVANAGADLAARLEFFSHSSRARVIVAVADNEDSLPRDCRIVIKVSGARGCVIRHPEQHMVQAFVPDYTSDREARRCVDILQQAALSQFKPVSDAIPSRVALCDLFDVSTGTFTQDLSLAGTAPVSGLRSDSLATVVGMGMGSRVSVDLVKDGPHAIVGGTTGSGKSEVLVSWILSLAATYAPTEVSFLLVDFKGGAAFAPVGALPHTVGVLTDLDEATSRRAILSLQAELRRRETTLADAMVRSIGELPQDQRLPRLVIVIDEFAAMTTSFPEMHDLFSDLAARGRSLGIHLILCTQRPAGTIRDSVLANCTLRISLRVNNAADSIAVIGIPDAAKIDASVPGRALLLRAGSVPESVQWAIANENDAREVASRVAEGAIPMKRPWLDPLPGKLDCFSPPGVVLPNIAFGLADIPEEQRQEPAVYNPMADGNLFVVGGHRSGKSTFLSSLAQVVSDIVTVPADGEGAWDAVSQALEAVRKGEGPTLVLVDDLDLVVSRLSQEHEAEIVERILSIAREGPRAGTALVVTSRSMRGRMQSVFSLCSSTLIMKMRDRQEHVLVGGEATDYSSRLPPGGGQWRGHRIQVCTVEPLVSRPPVVSPPLQCSPRHVLVMVSSRPETIRGELERVGNVTVIDARTVPLSGEDALRADDGVSPNILLGHPDAWLSSPALLASLRSSASLHSSVTMAFHDCSLIEFRSIARTRELPPPIESPHNTVIVLNPDGSMHRASLHA